MKLLEIIEDVIGGAEGVKNIDSISENGRRATIKIEFETSIDLGLMQRMILGIE